MRILHNNIRYNNTRDLLYANITFVYVLVVMYFVYDFTPYSIIYMKINTTYFYFQKNLNIVRRCLLKLELCAGIKDDSLKK